jgi:hypothetical protein
MDRKPEKKAHLRIRFMDGTVVEKELDSEEHLQHEITKLYFLFQEITKMKEAEGETE